MEFEWDDTKAESNFVKHGILFEEAIEIFYDENRFIEEDDRFDYGENRYKTLGKISQRVFVVVYVERRQNLIRIISARKANRREVKKWQLSQKH